MAGDSIKNPYAVWGAIVGVLGVGGGGGLYNNNGIEIITARVDTLYSRTDDRFYGRDGELMEKDIAHIDENLDKLTARVNLLPPQELKDDVAALELRIRELEQTCIRSDQ